MNADRQIKTFPLIFGFLILFMGTFIVLWIQESYVHETPVWITDDEAYAFFTETLELRDVEILEDTGNESPLFSDVSNVDFTIRYVDDQRFYVVVYSCEKTVLYDLYCQPK